MSELHFPFLPHPPSDKPSLRVNLEHCLRDLQECLSSGALLDLDTDKGRKALADLLARPLLAFGKSLVKVQLAVAKDDPTATIVINTLQDMQKQNPHMHNASALLGLSVTVQAFHTESKDKERRRKEGPRALKLVKPKKWDDDKMTKVMKKRLEFLLSSYCHSGNPKAVWFHIASHVAEYADALLAALWPPRLDEDLEALQAMRAAIQTKGRDGKTTKSEDLVGIGGVAKQRALKALRELEARGEYDGFSHASHRRRQ